MESPSLHHPAGVDVPVIDLEASTHEDIVKSISNACSTFGCFQVTSHGISPDLLLAFKDACRQFFDLPLHKKYELKRNEHNARGFFDDELTKQRVDWKQCLDAGVPGSRDWTLTDDDPQNMCLDGCNQFPSCKNDLPQFRDIFVDYFEACSQLSHKITVLMAEGLGVTEDHEFVQSLKNTHTSYLRLNYYPPCDSEEDPAPLGISPHKDAGFLTVLLQDDDCHSLQLFYQQSWHMVPPVPGALTINTGDMAQIWSNGLYKAPLHRVLTSTGSKRYSAPYFYNPGYDMWIAPLNSSSTTNSSNNSREEAPESIKYHPVLWGYFRAVRFAGDLTDLGVEIQIDDFETCSKRHEEESKHLAKQTAFCQECPFREAFSVQRYRHILQD